MKKIINSFMLKIKLRKWNSFGMCPRICSSFSTLAVSLPPFMGTKHTSLYRWPAHSFTLVSLVNSHYAFCFANRSKIELFRSHLYGSGVHFSTFTGLSLHFLLFNKAKLSKKNLARLLWYSLISWYVELLHSHLFIRKEMP